MPGRRCPCPRCFSLVCESARRVCRVVSPSAGRCRVLGQDATFEQSLLSLPCPRLPSTVVQVEVRLGVLGPLIRRCILGVARVNFPAPQREKYLAGSPLFISQSGLAAAAGPAVVSHFATISPPVADFCGPLSRGNRRRGPDRSASARSALPLHRAPVVLCRAKRPFHNPGSSAILGIPTGGLRSIGPGLLECLVVLYIDLLAFHRLEATLRAGMLIGIATSGHAGARADAVQTRDIGGAGVLYARSQWWISPGGGWRSMGTRSSAASARRVSMDRDKCQPMQRREQASSTQARYAKVVGKRIYVISATQTRSSPSMAISRSRLG